MSQCPYGVKALDAMQEVLKNFGNAITFDVPAQPGPVVSGLRLGDKVLVRRTDFGDDMHDAELSLGDTVVRVPAAPGCCQILDLNTKQPPDATKAERWG